MTPSSSTAHPAGRTTPTTTESPSGCQVWLGARVIPVIASLPFSS